MNDMIDLDRILARVQDEYNAFRNEKLALTARQVYNAAHTIHIVEELIYLFFDCREDYEDEKKILAMLDQLTMGAGFLPVFLEWVGKQDSVDVSNVEQSALTLSAFCNDNKFHKERNTNEQ